MATIDFKDINEKVKLETSKHSASLPEEVTIKKSLLETAINSCLPNLHRKGTGFKSFCGCVSGVLGAAVSAFVKAEWGTTIRIIAVIVVLIFTAGFYFSDKIFEKNTDFHTRCTKEILDNIAYFVKFGRSKAAVADDKKKTIDELKKAFQDENKIFEELVKDD